MNSLKQFEKQNMKKDLITIFAVIAILLICVFSAKSQQHLPDTVTVKLSQRDLFAITQRIDSLQSAMVSTSVLPANQVTSFNQRLNIALSVMYEQIRRQMVADKVKNVEVPKKQ
jgi:hypothetical protein